MIRTQLDVLPRLEAETRRELRALEDEHLLRLAQLWDRATRDLKAHLGRSHRLAHPDGKWSLYDALFKGTLDQFNIIIAEVVGGYKKESYGLMVDALATIRKMEVRRAAWMLAQVVPPGFKVRAPDGASLREADTPEEPTFKWLQQWNQINDGWASAVSQNLKGAAASGSDPDAIDAIVDGTRSGFPAYKPFDAMKRVYVTAAISEQAQAQLDVSDANPDVADDEVWQTLEDTKVCPQCEDYFGESRADLEAEGVYIPAHMDDRCFWRIVPKAWADLLRSGDEFQRAMALQMDDQGLVEDALAVYGADGRTLIGRAVVSFEQWDAEAAEQEYLSWKADWEKRHPTKGQLLSQQGGQ